MFGAAVCISRNFSGLCLLMLFLAAGISSCKYNNPSEAKRITFKNVAGVNYIEVKRRFANGLSISPYGYGLTPSWKFSFYSDDSAKVYSPDSGAFLGFHVTLDHDSLFHVARTWFRAKKITKDSLVVQVMSVRSKVIYLDKSQVFLTFYSDKYIRDVLHTVPEALMRKTKQDTIFIQQRAAEVNTNPDSALACVDPPVFKSRTALATVKKLEVEGNLSKSYDNPDMPVYDITIKNTYKNFNYEILVNVDYNGNLHFQRSMWALTMEDDTSKEETIKTILNGYIKTYFNVTPGNSLGIPHNSLAILKISGREAAK